MNSMLYFEVLTVQHPLHPKHQYPLHLICGEVSPLLNSTAALSGKFVEILYTVFFLIQFPLPITMSWVFDRGNHVLTQIFCNLVEFEVPVQPNHK